MEIDSDVDSVCTTAVAFASKGAKLALQTCVLCLTRCECPKSMYGAPLDLHCWKAVSEKHYEVQKHLSGPGGFLKALARLESRS